MLDFKLLNDDELKGLEKALAAELIRRTFIREGLDIDERLQFDTVVDMIRGRAKRNGSPLSEADALALIRAHVPGRVRGTP